MSIPKEMLAMFEKMMNPAAYPLQPLMFPVADPAELEKKINELRTVKIWLEASVMTIDLSIQALEYQKSLLAPLTTSAPNQAFTANAFSAQPTAGANAATDDPTDERKQSTAAINPAVWAWDMMQKAASNVQASVAAAVPTKTKATTKKSVKKTTKATKATAKKVIPNAATKRAAKKQ